VYVVPSLAVPDSGDPLALAQLLENEAVQLFVQRAEAAKAGFAVTDKTGQSIATLCVQLDGLPLAIELAAAHAHLLSPRAMLRRLERRFDWLATGARDAPERHQTLRNALDWSYQRLGKDGRALFRHLGVFRGGCTLQAATTVCAALDLDVQTTLELLVAQNLVQQGEMAGEQRFVMLESIRQYALQRLRARGEETAARRRHALYYLALAETAEPELWGPQQVEWANQLEQELDNLRAAMSWSSSEGGDAALALAFAGATWHFWSFRSLLSEGRYWLSVLLSANPAPTPARIKALNELGVLAWFQGDIQAILPPLEEALGIAREIGDPFGLGMTLTSLGAVHHIIGADDRAISLLQESLTQALENQDKLVAHHAYFWLAQVAWMQERYDHAFMLLQNSLSLRRELGDSWSIAYALYMLGKWTRKQGNYEEADALLGESLMLRQQLNDRIGIIWNLDELACLATAQGLWQRGVRLFGAAEAIRTEIGSALLARWQEDVMGVVAEARGALGPAVFEQAWIEGQAMRLEEAVTFALSTI
jgi:tetratricopeptide (TPR) repeat protein